MSATPSGLQSYTPYRTGDEQGRNAEEEAPVLLVWKQLEPSGGGDRKYPQSQKETQTPKVQRGEGKHQRPR